MFGLHFLEGEEVGMFVDGGELAHDVRFAIVPREMEGRAIRIGVMEKRTNQQKIVT